MSTFVEKNVDQNKKAWFLLDAKDQIVGRLASKAASLLVGKHKPTYTRNADTGDFVIIVNADKVKFTGNKLEGKLYYDHTGYVSGLKEKTALVMLQKHPEEILKRAIWGMLHKSKLAKHQITKLKVYTTAEHPHTAQKVVAWTEPKRTVARVTKKVVKKTATANR